jgi:hypothetical protein
LTVSVTAFSISWLSPSDVAAPAVGKATWTPWFFVIESETMMKVANRKKMMSINGMISIRARFLPPLPDEPCMAGLFQVLANSWRGA